MRIMFKSFSGSLDNQHLLQEDLVDYIPYFYGLNCDMLIAQNVFNAYLTQNQVLGEIGGSIEPGYLYDNQNAYTKSGYVPTWANNTVCYKVNDPSEAAPIPAGIHKMSIPINGTFRMFNHQWFPVQQENTDGPVGVQSGLHICQTSYGFDIGHYRQYGTESTINTNNINYIVSQMKNYSGGRPFIVFTVCRTNGNDARNAIENGGLDCFPNSDVPFFVSQSQNGDIITSVLNKGFFVASRGMSISALDIVGPLKPTNPDNVNNGSYEPVSYVVDIDNYTSIKTSTTIGTAVANLSNIPKLVIQGT